MGRFELLYGNVNGVLKIHATPGEAYIVKGGAMVSMSNVFNMRVISGGVKKALGRMMGNQSVFLQEYSAISEGELVVSPSYLGDIQLIELDGSKNYRLGQNAFLASTPGIELNSRFSGGKGIFSGEGLVQVEATGRGLMALSAYGAIFKVNLQPNEPYIVDTNHLVLWDASMRYKVEMISNGLASFASGEGFVCKFQGPGEIWIQTKNPSYLVSPQT